MASSTADAAGNSSAREVVQHVLDLLYDRGGLIVDVRSPGGDRGEPLEEVPERVLGHLVALNFVGTPGRISSIGRPGFYPPPVAPRNGRYAAPHCLKPLPTRTWPVLWSPRDRRAARCVQLRV